MSQPINFYDEAQRVRCIGTFTDFAGALGDPSTVTFKFRSPAGLVTIWIYGADFQVVRESLGVYHADIDAQSDGLWTYRWQSTGNIQASRERSFAIRASVFQ